MLPYFSLNFSKINFIVKLSTGLRISEERIRGNFTVTNPNFNYSDKALSTDIFITDTDKLTDFGYKSTDAGFSIGTAFEQYDDFYFRPTFRTSSTFSTLSALIWEICKSPSFPGAIFTKAP